MNTHTYSAKIGALAIIGTIGTLLTGSLLSDDAKSDWSGLEMTAAEKTFCDSELSFWGKPETYEHIDQALAKMGQWLLRPDNVPEGYAAIPLTTTITSTGEFIPPKDYRTHLATPVPSEITTLDSRRIRPFHLWSRANMKGPPTIHVAGTIQVVSNETKRIDRILAANRSFRHINGKWQEVGHSVQELAASQN